MKPRRASEANVLSRYFEDIRDFPILTGDKAKVLARQYRRGREEALNKLVESNLRFVIRVACTYRNLGVPLEDLLNEGNLGLIEAANRYDPSMGTSFATYAFWWIRKRILHALSQHSRLVRIPVSQRNRVRKIRMAERRLRKELGREPRRGEVSREMDQSLAELDRVLVRSHREMSLEEPVGSDGSTCIADCLVDNSYHSPVEDLNRREAQRRVIEALRELEPRERKVIRWRYGLNGEAPLTLEQIGRRMHLSRERVRQIEGKATRRLRVSLSRSGTPCRRNPYL